MLRDRLAPKTSRAKSPEWRLRLPEPEVRRLSLRLPDRLRLLDELHRLGETATRAGRWGLGRPQSDTQPPIQCGTQAQLRTTLSGCTGLESYQHFLMMFL